ncbi:MAG: hypothetical protein ACI8RZ_005448, partial [Myxococcota bacterium]
ALSLLRKLDISHSTYVFQAPSPARNDTANRSRGSARA